MLSALLERIFQGVDDAASASTLKAQIELLKTAAEQLEKENNSLRQQHTILTEKVKSLEEIEKEYAKLNQFIDLGIIRIKIDPDGKRLPSLYCPQCDGMITNPEHMSEDQKFLFKVNPAIGCLKKCGYVVDYRLVLEALEKWDREHQPK